ncbi:MAG TPA: beta-glucosidase BglX, partial [Terriglobia bacterium]|nr:beta-glucosidase BglX [Terriglobia bacterium]
SASPEGSAQLSDAQVNQRVDALLGQMTMEEKIGQLAQLPGFSFGPGSGKLEDLLPKGQGGSVLWVNNTATINRLQHLAVEKSRLHIPLIFGLDVIHGFHTVFPVPIAMAASWDPSLVESTQTVAAREAASRGILWTFTPMVDIARDPRWGRIVEGAGEDPYLGAAMARAQVRGFQGPYIGSPGHILACAKHFAGYGAADGGRDYDSSYVPEDQMWNVYLPPFHAAEEAGVATFMSAYMDLNDVPATGNKWLLQDVLRNTWGFQGFVVSDAFSVRSLMTHGFARDVPDAGFRAFTAGVNMDMASGTYLASLPQFVKDGKISASQIDDAVRPILAMKIRLGLFEHPYVDEAKAAEVRKSPGDVELARAAAIQTMVLLRNEGGLLPLKKNIASIAVIGPLADSPNDTNGSWTVEGGPLDSTGAKPILAVTVLAGIRNKLGPSVPINYAPGPEIRRTIPSPFERFLNPHPKPPETAEQAKAAFDKAVETARKSDAVVMVLGELGNMSGEAASRATLDLPGRQEQLLEAIVALGKPVVLVLMNGRPLNISWAAEHVPAILEAWYPGSQGGNAVADVLFGDANPGGKLPISWPRGVGNVPFYYAHNLTQEPDNEPQFKSRYWDKVSSPLYPFGYGLSYSKFAFSKLVLSKPELKVGDELSVSVDVENTGTVKGDEVAQLYIHQRAGSASRPMRQLKGFERITLGPGEKKTVHFTLGKNELTYWSTADKKWVEDPEKFDVWVGGDSAAKLHGEFKVVP